MNGMSESFTNVGKRKLMNADHIGIKTCENIMDAEKISDELMKKYSGHIERITIVPR